MGNVFALYEYNSPFNGKPFIARNANPSMYTHAVFARIYLYIHILKFEYKIIKTRI